MKVGCFMYSEIVIDHFTNPRNIGELETYNGYGSAGDPNCGDYLEIYINVDNYIIKDIGFKVHGCVGAIASSSMTTELAKNKPVMAAFAIGDQDIVEALGGLPEAKIHCSLLGAYALKNAIIDYAKNRDNK